MASSPTIPSFKISVEQNTAQGPNPQNKQNATPESRDQVKMPDRTSDSLAVKQLQSQKNRGTWSFGSRSRSLKSSQRNIEKEKIEKYSEENLDFFLTVIRGIAKL